MKKLLYCVAIALAFTACDKGLERHSITILNPASGLNSHYADATLDSVYFYTFDSYESSCDQNWLTLDPVKKKANLPNTYYDMYVVSIPVTFAPNTTESVRTAYVKVHNYGQDWDQTVTVGFVQLGWLNVLRPQPDYVYNDSHVIDKANFLLTDSAEQQLDSIAFSVEKAWTLAASDFVTPQVTQGEGGDHIVRLNLTPNTTGQERTATLLLQSSGVTTPIKVTQKAPEQ